eukprot:PhM_4_TR2924/c0_g2_i1/m.51156
MALLPSRICFGKAKKGAGAASKTLNNAFLSANITTTYLRPIWNANQSNWCSLCQTPIDDYIFHKTKREHRAMEIVYDNVVCLPMNMRRWVPLAVFAGLQETLGLSMSRDIHPCVNYLEQEVRLARCFHALQQVYPGQPNFHDLFGSVSNGTGAMRRGTTAIRHLCALPLMRCFPFYSSGMLSPILAMIVTFDNCEPVFDFLNFPRVFPSLENVGFNTKKQTLKAVVGDLWYRSSLRREHQCHTPRAATIAEQVNIDHALAGIVAEFLIRRFLEYGVRAEKVWESRRATLPKNIPTMVYDRGFTAAATSSSSSPATTVTYGDAHLLFGSFPHVMSRE